METGSVYRVHVMDWKKGDLRRMLAVLGAISALKHPTLTQIGRALGWGANAGHTVRNLIAQAEEQAGVVIQRDGHFYEVADWGPVLKEDGVQQVWRAVTGIREDEAQEVMSTAGRGAPDCEPLSLEVHGST